MTETEQEAQKSQGTQAPQAQEPTQPVQQEPSTAAPAPSQAPPSQAPPAQPSSGRRVERGERDENTIYVGKKNVMAYVLAVVTQFNAGSPEVKLKARGRAISRSIDVTQIVKNRFLSSLKISDFKAETEELTSEDGSLSKVSSLTLTLTK